MTCVAWVIAAAALRYTLLSWRRKLGLARPTRASYDCAHEKTAQAIYRLATHLRGGFVKLGQVLAARSDFFPESFLQPIRRLHDSVPSRPLSALRPYLEKEIGAPLGEVFSRIEPEAMAAASLAQVHRATLLDGTEVVVKVQYPEARRVFPVDLSSLRFATRVVRRFNRTLDLRSLADELSRFVTMELDFSREAASTERVRAALEASSLDVVVPKVMSEHSSCRALVLEFISGTPLSRLDVKTLDDAARKRVAEQVAGVYVWMIFEAGFFHGDPHPGNILVRDQNIGLLDFGLARELPEGFADGVAKMIGCATLNDGPGTLRAAEAVGFRVGGAAPEAFVQIIKMLLGDYTGARNLGAILGDATLDGIPPHFALIVRVFILLNGLSQRLVPGERLVAQHIAKALLPRLAGAYQAQASAST